MAEDKKIIEYDAFISYRHCELDSFVATNLHRKLEKFKLPKSSKALLEEGVSDKIKRVFRDEDELPLATNLSDPIELALTNSGYLIVICTPRLKLSSWCQKEIETFIKLHGRNKILLVLAEGEPSESFPEIMTYEEVETEGTDGNKVIVRRPLEPLAADVRGKNNKERLKAMDNAVIKLVAAMKGLNYDDVKQRHREQKMKALIRFWSTVSVVIMLFAIVCLGMMAKINSQKNVIEDKYASSMANAAQDMLDLGRRQDAIYTVESVLPRSGDYNSDSYRMLSTAISPYSVGTSYIPTKSFKTQGFVADYIVSDNGKYIALCDLNNEVTIYNTDTSEIIANFEMSFVNDGLPYFGFDNETGFVYRTNEGVEYFNIQNQETNVICEDSGYVLASEECDVLTVFSNNVIYGYKDGEFIYETNLDDWGIDTTIYYEYDYGYSEDGELLSIAMRGYEEDSLVFVIETKDGKVKSNLKVKADGSLCVAANDNNIYLISFETEDNKSILSLIDMASGEILETNDIPMVFIENIKLVNDELFMYSSSTGMLLDADTFQTIAIADQHSMFASGLVKEGKSYLVDDSGKLIEISEEYPYGMDVTLMTFGIRSNGEVAKASCSGDKLFYQFYDTNYVALYENNPDKAAVQVPESDFENSDKFDCIFLEDEEIQEYVKDVNFKYVSEALLSSNEKLVLAIMRDGSLRIYDAKKKKHIKNLYLESSDMASSLTYLKEDNIYVIDAYPYAYVLDKDLNCIAQLGYVAGYENHSFIVDDMQGNYYKVPYVSYKEMLKKADSLLEGYEPDAEMIERYGIK